MVHDDKFDALLGIRTVPEMRSNLEHRILQTSLQNQNMRSRRGKRSIFSAIFDSILLPRPVMSLALVLMLGVTIGAYSATDGGVSQTEVDTYFLVADDIEYGELL